MPEKNNNRVKIYITIGLAIVLVVNGYFRFIHARIRKSGEPATPQPTLARIDIPQILTKIQEVKQSEPDRMKILQYAVKDIFAEPVRPSPVKAEFEEKEVEKKPAPPPPMTLKGTIVGGKRPIAIINDRFVRLGDRIGDYQVVEIDKDIVKMLSENNEIVLTVLKYVSK